MANPLQQFQGCNVCYILYPITKEEEQPKEEIDEFNWNLIIYPLITIVILFLLVNCLAAFIGRHLDGGPSHGDPTTTDEDHLMEEDRKFFEKPCCYSTRDDEHRRG